MEFRWDGPQQVKNLGDSPSKSQINALFAIPGATKSDSSLPHHDVSDGHVGAADKDGCIAAIEALNGSRGGVTASAAEKSKAYSHLASHLRALGVEPPAKQFAAGQPMELRQQRRSSMLRVPERLSLQFGAAGMEMRAKANGTGGTKFQFNGYAAVYDHPFDMWDFWGDEFTEVVNQGACTRTLANGCDVPFLIGHNDAGIPMARTKSGTMTLGQDSHGLWVVVPEMDGSRDDVRALASAVERGDLDEMSCAFMVMQQVWSPDYEQRNIVEMDLHKGDVSAVVFGANDGTAGSSMTALPVEGLSLRRPVGMLRNRRAGEAQAAAGPGRRAAAPRRPVSVRMPTQPYAQGADEGAECGQCHSGNAADAAYCDQCGSEMNPSTAYAVHPGDTQVCPWCRLMNGADAKVCDQCGRGLVNDHDGDDPGYAGGTQSWRFDLDYAARRPAEQRGAFQVDTTDGPDYDPGPHAADAGQLVCPHGSCADDACACGAPSCNGACPVTGGAANAPDAKCCDQCGGSLYSEDGTIILGDSGIPEELEGDTAMALARSRAELELRRRRLALLGA